MAERKDDPPPKRLNRAASLGEALGRTLDPAFRKRGFAGRDLITNWPAIVPRPYDTAARPDRLAWPRGVRTAEGATLYLRVAPGHALALQHEGGRIAAAINTYFGYLLVGAVRLSPMPLVADATPVPTSAAADPDAEAEIGRTVASVEDPGLRDALARLGRSLSGRR